MKKILLTLAVLVLMGAGCGEPRCLKPGFQDDYPVLGSGEGALYMDDEGNDCDYGNTFDCTDFCTQHDAQRAFDHCYHSSGDVFELDRDGDGVACETLP